MEEVKAINLVRVSTQKQEYERQVFDNNSFLLECGFKQENIILIGSKETGYNKKKTKGWYKMDGTDKEAIDRLIKTIEEENIKNVCITELSRLSREQDIFWYLIRSVFQKNNITLYISSKKQIVSSKDLEKDSTIIQFTLENMMAHLEGKQLSKRAKSGRLYKYKEIGVINRPPFGYKNTKSGVVIDRQEANIIKDVFKLASEEKTNAKINEYLNDKYNITFSPQRLGHILNNEFYYTGKTKITIEDVTGEKHSFTRELEPLIDKKTFQKVKEYRTRYIKGVRTKGIKYQVLLRKKIICPSCGSFLRYRGNTNSYYCVCKNKKKGGNFCSASKLDSVVWYYLRFFLEKQIVKEENYNYEKQEKEYLIKEAEINSRLDKIKKELKRIIDLYRFGDYTKKQYTSIRNELLLEEKELKRELSIEGNNLYISSLRNENITKTKSNIELLNKQKQEQIDKGNISKIDSLLNVMNYALIKQKQEQIDSILKNSSFKQFIIYASTYIKSVELLGLVDFDFEGIGKKEAIKIKINYNDNIDKTTPFDIVYIKFRNGGRNDYYFADSTKETHTIEQDKKLKHSNILLENYKEKQANKKGS